MIFTSYTYLAFLAVAFVAHWLMPAVARKAFLVVASYFFYCTWDWRFGFLLLAVSVFNFSYAKYVLAKAPTGPKLALGILANLAPLLYYKYWGFALTNVSFVAEWLGVGERVGPVNLFIPLGISFFTFQGVAYLVDVVTGDEPLNDPLDFLFFKAFWPQLIAGPIIRLHELRDQIAAPRTMTPEDLSFGAYRILRGFFKKICLADQIAPAVDLAFQSPTAPNALDCVVGVLGFGLQIYFDFSAYSEIAIGSARLFGFRFPENFAWPYLTGSPQEFWARWHMTLSRWIRDYVFTPLNFAARDTPWLGHVWLILAMTLCGLWHGAAWTFVVWGFWHGVLLVLNQTLLKSLFPRPARTPGPDLSLARLPGTLATFVAVTIGWLFFRAQSLEQCVSFVKSVATLKGGVRPSAMRENDVLIVAFIFLGTVAVYFARSRNLFVPLFATSYGWVALRAVIYVFMMAAVIVFDREAQAFVYFQF